MYNILVIEKPYKHFPHEPGSILNIKSPIFEYAYPSSAHSSYLETQRINIFDPKYLHNFCVKIDEKFTREEINRYKKSTVSNIIEEFNNV